MKIKNPLKLDFKLEKSIFPIEKNSLFLVVVVLVVDFYIKKISLRLLLQFFLINGSGI